MKNSRYSFSSKHSKMFAKDFTAIELLLNDHKHFRATFKEIALSYPRVPTLKIRQLLTDLDVHEHMEQGVWYPLIRIAANSNACSRHCPAIITRLMQQESKAEALVKKLKSDLNSHNSKKTEKVESLWRHFTKLWQDVLKHADNEETQLFPLVKQSMTHRDLVMMAELMILFAAEYRGQTKA